MENGEAEDPELTAGLEGFLEGVERRVTGENDGLGIVHSEAAARQMDGVPTPPEGLTEPVWDDAKDLWRDGAQMDGGIVLHAPAKTDGTVRDSESEKSDGPLGGQAVDGVEPIDEDSLSD